MSDEEDRQEEKKAIGPKCDVCKQSTDSLYPVLVKREIRGMYEMVQIYLCAFHLLEREEEDALPPPPEDTEKNLEELFKDLMEGQPDEDEEEKYGLENFS